MKIVQITAGEQGRLYGLDEDGGLWQWMPYTAPLFGKEGLTAGWMYLGPSETRCYVIPAAPPPSKADRNLHNALNLGNPQC